MTFMGDAFCNATSKGIAMDKNVIRVNPEDIKAGDLLAAYGYVMLVEKITIWCHSSEQFEYHKGAAGEHVDVRDNSKFHDPNNLRDGEDLACFGVRGSFVSGDKKMFDLFRSTISYGPNCGKREELSYQQGNSRASWHVLQQEEAIN